MPPPSSYIAILGFSEPLEEQPSRVEVWMAGVAKTIGLRHQRGVKQARRPQQRALGPGAAAIAAGLAADKLVRRHPHVFAGAETEGAAGVVRSWEEIKRAEREEDGEADTSALAGVPRR